MGTKPTPRNERIENLLNAGYTVNWGLSGPVDSDRAQVHLRERPTESEWMVEVVECDTSTYEDLKSTHLGRR